MLRTKRFILSSEVLVKFVFLFLMLYSRALASDIPPLLLSVDNTNPVAGDIVKFSAAFDGLSDDENELIAEEVLAGIYLRTLGTYEKFDDAYPFEWEITFSNSASGSVTYFAETFFGFTHVKSKEIELQIVTEAELNLLYFDPSDAISIYSGQSQQLRLFGLFSDGFIRDMSDTVNGTVYSESIIDGANILDEDSPSIEISGYGLVSALEPGLADVVATNGVFSTSKRIEVIAVEDSDTDGDGLSDDAEEMIGTSKYILDSDYDGSPDFIEVGGDELDPLDYNHDGIIDAMDSSVIAIEDGTGSFVSISSSAGILSVPTQKLFSEYPNRTNGFGSVIAERELISFRIEDLEDRQPVDVILDFHSLPTTNVYLKYGLRLPDFTSEASWYNFTNFTVNDSTITLHLTDNQLGDSNPTLGVITDPGGPGYASEDDNYDVVFAESPDADASPNEIAENSEYGTLVGITADAYDEDFFDSEVTYMLTEDGDGNFSIDSNSGVVIVNNGANIDYESGVFSYTIYILARSEDGSQAVQEFIITVLNQNEYDVTFFDVPDANNSSNEIFENSDEGTVVGITAYAYDGDVFSDKIRYTLLKDGDGNFTIDDISGIISVSSGANVDYEAGVFSYTVEVLASSEDGSQDRHDFTILVLDEDEYDVKFADSPDVDNSPNEIYENSVENIVVGVTAYAYDDDAFNGAIVYTLISDGDGNFSIGETSGVISVNAGANIDYESGVISYTVEVLASSEDGSEAMQAFTISVLDENEFDVAFSSTSPDSDDSQNKVSVNANYGSLVGITANAQDLDGSNNTVSYSLVDGSNTGQINFSINSNTGVVSLGNGTLISDNEVGLIYEVNVLASSSDGSEDSASFDVLIVEDDDGGSSVVDSAIDDALADSDDDQGGLFGCSYSSQMKSSFDPLFVLLLLIVFLRTFRKRF